VDSGIRIRARRGLQSGYILLVLMLMVALLMLAVTAAAPKIAQENKRERENEMIHRGAQYVRAIKRFYRKFGRYPTSIDQLEDTNHMRFLRQAYADPMSKDGKWKLLHPGDVVLGGSNVGTSVASMAANTQQPSGLAGMNASTSGLTPSGGTGGLSGSSTSGQPGSSTLGSTTNNSQIGGMIIGVASTSKAEGIHEFNGKSKYNEWYFVYDPTIDRGGLITGPYTGKTFSAGTGASIPGATPAGQQSGGFGQPIRPGGFGQPMGGQPMGGPGGPGGPVTPPKQ
jgi:type II secretory pathway pseudopilin PulG